MESTNLSVFCHLIIILLIEKADSISTEGCDNKSACQCKVEEISNFTTCHCEDFDGISQNAIGFISCEKLLDFKETLTDLTITSMRKLDVIKFQLFENTPNLKYIRIVHTSLTLLPQLKGLGKRDPMHTIDFESNKIKLITSNNVAVRAERFFLNHNEIKEVDGWAFNGSEIGKLSFLGNKDLRHLSDNAFSGLKSLRDLDLSDTSISFLPFKGLQELEILRLRNTHSLKVLPSLYDLNRLKNAWLTYSFHCCGLSFPEKHNPERHKKYLVQVQEICDKLKRFARSQSEQFGPIVNENEEQLSSSFGFKNSTFPGQMLDKIQVQSYENEDNWSTEMDKVQEKSEEIFHDTSAALPTGKIQAYCGNITKRRPVQCWPKPDALNPCEDMMSWSWLRVSVWFVLSTAIIGNTAVLTVLSLNHSESSVSRLLMLHLAFADLCMAIYLLLLASMDLVSTEAYFNYAYDWQRGHGCKIAGFLTVFASQLSLFTLCLLTIERWFAIRYALYTNRLDYGLAKKIMFFGWIYAFLMAILPLTGISSYSKTSICLPMDTRDIASVVYILVLLTTAGLGFVLICVCYTQIYLSLSYETRTSASEGRVAHKMALLVATNFICWAPIAFFSLTAVAGYPLINVTQSKILLVFVYPVNSCANPYLYAILTKQFRKDFILLLSRHGLCTKCAQEYRMVYSRPTSNDNPIPNVTADTIV